MYFSYFDSKFITFDSQAHEKKRLDEYRKHVKRVVDDCDDTHPEYSLAHVKTPELQQKIKDLRGKYLGIQHLILVGIGGSNLGTKAVHEVLDCEVIGTHLDCGKIELHTLDTVSAYDVERLVYELRDVKSASQLLVVVISKSGSTAETLVSAGVLLDALEKKFEDSIYGQTIFIGNADTEFMKEGERLGAATISMPEIVGGRFSVATEVGLIPLALLGHDTDSYIDGIIDATTEKYEALSAESATRIYSYIENGYAHYNFFVFKKRLGMLGAWYRQLFAESTGKEHDRDGNLIKKGFLPTISTPVELHSVGQLYLSGYAGVYTDFIAFNDNLTNSVIPKEGIAKAYGDHYLQDIASALYGGVRGAYRDRNLPYRSTVFNQNLTYSLGLFMGMRMLEVMYVAELMNVNAFNQPNVELYKSKTRNILGL